MLNFHLLMSQSLQRCAHDSMMSSYEERCSWTSTPGREAYRHTASGPERSDEQTDYRLSPDQSTPRSVFMHSHQHVVLLLVEELPLALKGLFSLWFDWLLITCTCVLLRQPRHSYVCVRVLAMAISPHRLHTWTWYGSDASNRRSRRNWAAPCAIWQSRSISPNRRPPSLGRWQMTQSDGQPLDRSTGCRTERSHSPGSSLHWLPVEDLDRTTGPRVDLVVHHVFQTLVIGRTDEDLRRQLPPREAIIQNLTTDQ